MIFGGAGKIAHFGQIAEMRLVPIHERPMRRQRDRADEGHFEGGGEDLTAEQFPDPGHGFTESGPVSREELVSYHRALKSVVDEATRLHNAGVPVDQAIKQANWGEYATWTLASSQGPIAIRKVYEELDGKLR